MTLNITSSERFGLGACRDSNFCVVAPRCSFGGDKPPPGEHGPLPYSQRRYTCSPPSLPHSTGSTPERGYWCREPGPNVMKVQPSCTPAGSRHLRPQWPHPSATVRPHRLTTARRDGTREPPQVPDLRRCLPAQSSSGPAKKPSLKNSSYHTSPRSPGTGSPQKPNCSGDVEDLQRRIITSPNVQPPHQVTPPHQASETTPTK